MNLSNRKKHALCTLFNSMYLDKGLVLYKSLEKINCEFTLYVLAMDSRCYEILSDLNYDNLVPIKLQDFESKDLLSAKSNRSFGLYCWTCSSSLIKYILERFQPDYCTYIDADMAFYSDPYVLVDELEKTGKDVSLVAHRFSWFDKKREKTVGRFCVECNTFRNSDESKRLLDIWIGQCIEDCSAKGDGVHWGDQMYISEWDKKYESVIESKHYGAGVAPWNLSQYKLLNNNSGTQLKYKGHQFPLLFFHFEGITYSSINDVNIHVYSDWGIDDTLVEHLYYPYLKQINQVKSLLREKYRLSTIITSHPAMKAKKEETRIDKLTRRIKSIFSLDFVDMLFHGLPSNLYAPKNLVRIDSLND